MEKEKTIDAINKLIEISKGRIEGYKKASEITEDSELKGLFKTFVQTSKEHLIELKGEIKKFNGTETEGITALRSYFRAWMDIRTGLTGKDRKTILKSCVFGEENAVKVYKNILDTSLEHLNDHQQVMIKSQLNRLRSDQSTLKSMQNTLIETQ